MSDTAYPSEVNLVLFTRAYESHLAATSLIRRGNVPKPDNMDEATYAQRKAILAVGVKLVLAERDQLLDQFCQAWLAHRSK
jgi:hypothetical protein